MNYRPVQIAFCLIIPLFLLSCSGAPIAEANPEKPKLEKPVSGKPDFDQHVTELKKRLPSNDFTIVVQPPFVVIGDETASVVKQRADDTVKWNIDKLKQDYFTED